MQSCVTHGMSGWPGNHSSYQSRTADSAEWSNTLWQHRNKVPWHCKFKAAISVFHYVLSNSSMLMSLNICKNDIYVQDQLINAYYKQTKNYIYLSVGFFHPSFFYSVIGQLIFHRIGPLGRFDLVVAMSVCLMLFDVVCPFSCTRFWGLFCPHFPKSDVQKF